MKILLRKGSEQQSTIYIYKARISQKSCISSIESVELARKKAVS